MTSYHPAFETLSLTELPEYRARGILLRHKKTGCEVYKLESDEQENSFAFVFRTPPRDGRGAAHIVEHSVLCGSAAYPVKDAFLVMARRSLATFLNALTYPDKTVYPAASAVEADFYNLMSVYADAVFFPRLTRETFLQEAHHLEYMPDGGLRIMGVVYNEMRGDYSSADSLVGTASSTSLFTPGHPYSYDSGGDPEIIPELTYGDFKSFWAEHYHPSNCKVFLHGNLELRKELDFLDSNFLSRFERRTVSTEVPLQPSFIAARRIARPYPVAEGSEASTQIVVNWLTAPVTDEVEALGLELLSEILLGHDGSALAEALRSSQLGEDLSPQCVLDTVYRQIIFSAGLRGARRGEEDKLEALILEVIRKLVNEGIPEPSREAALHSIAFSNKEIRRGSTSYGLRLLSRSLRGWLHGSGPEATLSFEAALIGLQARLAQNPRYLEDLASRWILNNPHRSTVTVYPEAGLLERKKAETEEALAAREKALSPAEKEAIRAEAVLLGELQSEPDASEKLELLPRLRIADIPRTIERIPRDRAEVLGSPLSLHPIFTNGIVYLDLAFPIETLPRKTLVWLPLLSRFIAGAGLPGSPYGKVAEALSLNAGGFGASLDAGSPLGGAPGGMRPVAAYMIFRLKALAERFPAALELAFRLLSAADYSDHKRVADLLAELGNDIISALVPGGNSFALARAGSYHSQALSLEELWRGMSQFFFIRKRREEGQIEELSGRLGGLRSALFSRQGLRMGLSASPELLANAHKTLEAALSLLPASPAALPELPLELEAPTQHEAFAISAQVGFAAAACRASRIGSPEFSHETILAHLLTTGALWEEIRVRRGAYGASAYIEALEGVSLFSTYRDPKPVDSLAYFGEALAAAARGEGLEAAEESVVGSLGRDLRPLLPEEKSIIDFRRELFAITDELRQEKREALLSTSAQDLRRAAGRLAEAYRDASTVLISHAEDVQLAGRLRGDTTIFELPL